MISNHKIATIVHDLEECFDGRPWYGDSLMGKLDSLDWQYVNERRYGKKSIAVLVQHILNWRVFVLKKLEGDLDYDLIIDGPNDWTEVNITTKEEWEGLKSELKQTQEDILGILSNSSDDLLEKKVPGKKYTFGNVLPSIAQHDIYHLGQIAMLYTMGKS
ncbi:DinB family protein [Ulvibacterium marinum]|uniref:DinB family protein n=1 Tax=Ulvibacterium marinum TaxID=2419782 RepID=UPI0024952BF9|nr:DinB family protein [Ulvibacterium marinum]